MFDHKIKKLPKNTVEIIVKIDRDTIKKEHEAVFEMLRKELAVEGFRKGKAPRNIAEKHLDKQKIYEELIKRFLPRVYQKLIEEEKLKPIGNPQIELLKAKEDDDWEIKFTIAQAPTVDLKNYKESVNRIKSEAKKESIWTPGKTSLPQDKQTEEARQKLLNKVLAQLLKDVACEISDLIVSDELNRRLAALVDDIRKIGLTVETYLKSKNTTMDDLKKRYSQEIIDTYKLEFILQTIADKEGIKVDDKDLEKLFSAAKTEEERQAFKQNAYFYASILRKQKTLDYLLSL